MQKIAILISGRGSNMQAIVQAQQAGQINAPIAVVISNRADAQGLQYAQSQGIATAVLSHQDYPSREAYDAALATLIDSYGCTCVVLAGFMRILSAQFTAHYAGRMLNIHPSLLPSFTGLDTHQRALDAGVKWHGCTVHFVTAELDHGPIVAQAVVPVLDDDTEASLAARILAQEHIIYPQAVAQLVAGQLKIDGQRVQLLK